MQTVKVQYFTESSRKATSPHKEYLYSSERLLSIGDIVIVPIGDNETGTARVVAIDVSEADVQAFFDELTTTMGSKDYPPLFRLKTIPAQRIITEQKEGQQCQK